MEETSSSSKVIRKVMKDTFALRRKWIIAEAPQVSTVLQKFPALKKSKYLWRELVAIVGTDNEEVASERWKMLIPKVYRLAKRQKVGRVSLLYLKLSSDVGVQLSFTHKAEKEEARDMLQMILSSVRFLARQGLALCGDGNDAFSNLTQLLNVRAEDNPKILPWITKKACKHMHPDNQNEMLELMAHQVLRRILDDAHTSPFLAVMVDETRDQSNKEQLTLVLRWVSDDFTVSDKFVRLSVIDAQSIVDAIKDAFCGSRYLSQNFVDCLDTCYEIVKLIKFSAKQEAMLFQLKEEIGSDTPGVRTLCPTRSTVRTESLHSILANYEHILLLWETGVHEASDTEMKARIRGVWSQMQSFNFLFCIVLSEMILRHTDKLSQTLKQPKLSSVEGHDIAMLTVKTLEGLRTENDFELFWQKIEKLRIQFDIDEPLLPRKRKVPQRFEAGIAPAEFATSPKDEYRRVFLNVLTLQ
eukprot:Em0009g214a